MFRHIERAVGGIEQIQGLGRLLVAGIADRAADAGRHQARRQIESMRDRGLPQRALDTLADTCAPGRIRVRQQHREFFAAITRREIGAALRLGQDFGHRLQTNVAGRMPIRIVELLEMVDVDHQQRERCFIAAGPGPFRIQPHVEATAVGKPG